MASSNLVPFPHISDAYLVFMRATHFLNAADLKKMLHKTDMPSYNTEPLNSWNRLLQTSPTVDTVNYYCLSINHY